MRLFGFILLMAAGLQAAESSKETSQHQQFVIGISPFLDRAVKDDVYRGVVRLLVEELPLDSTVAIYDAFHLRSITELTLPNLRAFNSPKTRANQFAPAIQSLKRFLSKDHSTPTNSRLQFECAIRLPQFAEFLTENLPAVDAPLRVLLMGSPLYQDAKEPAFSMAGGYFPSDGHLKASSEKSVFGMRGPTNPTRPWTVYWVYFGDPWLNDLHKEKITRFWTLYFERRAGSLAAFSSDLTTVLRAFRQGGLPAAQDRWAIDPEQTKIEMLRVSRDVEVADWITRETLTETAQEPPSVMVGQMKIGIRWGNAIDLDLYATPRTGAETLFFQHSRSPEGYYYKDHRFSPGREYEFIEFESPVDARKVEAFVNFYKGSCPGGARGEARIEFDGRIYSAPFSVPAARGNLGRSGRNQQGHWTQIPVQKILKIQP